MCLVYVTIISAPSKTRIGYQSIVSVLCLDFLVGVLLYDFELSCDKTYDWIVQIA